MFNFTKARNILQNTCLRATHIVFNEETNMGHGECNWLAIEMGLLRHNVSACSVWINLLKRSGNNDLLPFSTDVSLFHGQPLSISIWLFLSYTVFHLFKSNQIPAGGHLKKSLLKYLGRISRGKIAWKHLTKSTFQLLPCLAHTYFNWSGKIFLAASWIQSVLFIFHSLHHIERNQPFIGRDQIV